jgi:hypothetical protein
LTKGKDFRGTPHFYSLPQGERKEKRKDFNKPLTLALSHGGEKEEKEKRENLFYIGRGGAFYRGVGEDEECDRVIVSLGS